MNPTKINELKAIAESGEHMPQKSTYFLPKMLSGLVMYKMDIWLYFISLSIEVFFYKNNDR